MLHRWQEEQQSSRSTAGRIVPLSVLAVHLFSIAHILARFESFEMKFSMPGISGGIVRKNKMIQLFRSMSEGKHVLFCSY